MEHYDCGVWPGARIYRLGVSADCVGIGEAGATPPAHSLLSDYFPPGKRATVLAIYASSVPVGSGLGYWLGGTINDAFGWRMAFVIVGLPGILVALLVRLTVREPVRGGSQHQPLNVRQYSLKEVWQFLSQLPSGRRISLAAACIAFAGYGLAAWIPAFFVRIHHMTPGQLGLWMSWITALGGIIGSLSGGVISDRWGRTYPRARSYVSMSGALLSIPFNVASVLLDDHRLALLCFLPATIGGDVVVWSSDVDRTRSRAARHARHGVRRVHFHSHNHRFGRRATSDWYSQRLDRHAGRHSLFVALRRDRHEPSSGMVFLVDRKNVGSGFAGERAGDKQLGIAVSTLFFSSLALERHESPVPPYCYGGPSVLKDSKIYVRFTYSRGEPSL